MKKRIMHDFVISELSAVDSPAQVHAKALIAKSISKQKTDAVSFDSFEDACAYLRKTGLAGTEAMIAARHAHPSLFTKSQNRDHKVTDEETAIAKARAGRARQNQIDALVRTTAAEKGLSRTDALRVLRKSSPEIF